MSHHVSGPNFTFPHGDARLDMTDLYAFTKPGDPGKSIIVLNVHPSMGVNPMAPTTREPFAPGALYEIKVDTKGDAIADLCYGVQFAVSKDGTQTATVRRTQGTRAVGAGVRTSTIVCKSVGMGRLFTPQPKLTPLGSVVIHPSIWWTIPSAPTRSISEPHSALHPDDSS